LSIIGIRSAPESDNISRRKHAGAGILPVQESGGRNFFRYRNPAPADNSGRDIAGFRPSRSDLAKTAGIRPDLDGSGY
jgi:hypothetical protein